jgi:hypothetical protein
VRPARGVVADRGIPPGRTLPEGRLWAELALAYRHHGYLRRPAQARRQTADGAADWMVGFVFRSPRQARRLGRLLAQAGFRAEEPARRAGLWIVSVPGMAAVGCFMLLGVLARLLPGAAGPAPATGEAPCPRP